MVDRSQQPIGTYLPLVYRLFFARWKEVLPMKSCGIPRVTDRWFRLQDFKAACPNESGVHGSGLHWRVLKAPQVFLQRSLRILAAAKERYPYPWLINRLLIIKEPTKHSHNHHFYISFSPGVDHLFTIIDHFFH